MEIFTYERPAALPAAVAPLSAVRRAERLGVGDRVAVHLTVGA